LTQDEVGPGGVRLQVRDFLQDFEQAMRGGAGALDESDLVK